MASGEGSGGSFWRGGERGDKIVCMRRYSVGRNETAKVTQVTWTDDAVVEWPGPEATCFVQAVLDYQDADVRLLLRRGPSEQVLASGLGREFTYNGKHALAEGDEVVIQWRALVPSVDGLSNVVELTVEEIEDHGAGVKRR
jgi:hypothetical protein